MLEVMALPFMQRALVAGVLAAALASYYGVFVTQRGLSFLGSGLAHAAFGGVALGLFLGVQPLAVAVPFTLLVALAITFVRERTELSGDTTIGVFFAVSVALGVVFLALKSQYTVDAYAYLFGSILGVTHGDIALTGAMLGLTAVLAPLWGRWAYATFDRELAAADRLKVQAHDYVLAALVAVSIVLSIRVLGSVLIAAFLVIPGAAARLVVRRFSTMTVVAVAIGVTTTVVGLAASYLLDVPSGATIVLTQALVFFVLLLVAR